MIEVINMFSPFADDHHRKRTIFKSFRIKLSTTVAFISAPSYCEASAVTYQAVSPDISKI